MIARRRRQSLGRRPITPTRPSAENVTGSMGQLAKKPVQMTSGWMYQKVEGAAAAQSHWPAADDVEQKNANNFLFLRPSPSPPPSPQRTSKKKKTKRRNQRSYSSKKQQLHIIEHFWVWREVTKMNGRRGVLCTFITLTLSACLAVSHVAQCVCDNHPDSDLPLTWIKTQIVPIPSRMVAERRCTWTFQAYSGKPHARVARSSTVERCPPPKRR